MTLAGTGGGRPRRPEVAVGGAAERSIAGLQAGQADGTLTAVGVTAAFLERIEALDRGEPGLRAVLALDPDALAIAAGLDAERAERGPRSALHGVPVLLKDNIDTAGALATTAGSLALAGNRAPRDATLVRRLRAAGAIVLGKANLSEWANFRSSRGCSGWSSVGGQTRNPYALDRSPSGSSSGSAVAVAADLCTVAVGTETDGSIVGPAAVNGIVGMKPTVGLVSRHGIVPLAASQDTAGPLARSVADAAALLAVMAGRDPADPRTHARPARLELEAGLRDDALRGVRLGVARDCFGRHEAADAVAEAALTVLRELGAEVVDDVAVGVAGLPREAEMTVLSHEFKAGLDAYLAAHPAAGVRTLADVIAFNQEHAGLVLAYFGQDLLERAQASGGLDAAEYLEARALCLRRSRDEGIDRALRTQRLDALVAPTAAPAWTIDPIAGDRNLGGSARAAALAGYPHITVPAGSAYGLPLGLSFFAGAYRDADLLAYAFAFERATRARTSPTFAPHAAAVV